MSGTNHIPPDLAMVLRAHGDKFADLPEVSVPASMDDEAVEHRSDMLYLNALLNHIENDVFDYSLTVRGIDAGWSAELDHALAEVRDHSVWRIEFPATERRAA